VSADSDTGLQLKLPQPDGTLARYTLTAGPRSPQADYGKPTSRVVYAAAHVVADPLSEGPQVDWDATMRFRHYLWQLGFGVADAMDTAQRGGGLDWSTAKELIARSGRAASSCGGELVCGALTDQLPADGRPSLDQIVSAYLEQAEWIRRHGGTPVIMASRHLARAADGPADYLSVYQRVLRNVDGPVMLHWLGKDFDPGMASYWGSKDLDAAAATVLQLIHDHVGTVTGIKLSLLEDEREVRLRRQLPAGVAMFTGDDFNYVPLIRGDEHGYSNALLGVFDAIALPARQALSHLDEGDADAFIAALEPTVPLARHLFRMPTSAYKTGVVFLAWLNGHQDHFRMIGGAEGLRSVPHLTELFRLADQAGALEHPDLAAHRMRSYLAVAGIEA
jgi:hypothetical protein